MQKGRENESQVSEYSFSCWGWFSNLLPAEPLHRNPVKHCSKSNKCQQKTYLK